MQSNETSITRPARDIALRWIRSGRAVIPVPHQSKSPVLPGWQTLRITEQAVDDYFNGDENIGLLLGAPSAGLVDIDLDCTEACEVAPVFFPRTVTFGRASRPNSHFLLVCPEATTAKYSHEGMLLEIRSTGCQTLIPGSTHPSGERIEGRSGKPAHISLADLISAAGRTASAALLARQWQKINSSRHEAALALAGALLHAGWSREETITFVDAIVSAAHDEEAKDRLRAAEDTATRHAAGEIISGWPTLSTFFDAAVIKKIRKWLAITDGPTLHIGGKPIEDMTAEWPEPEPLRRELPPAEAYPIEALGDVLGPMARAIMDTVQCPDAVAGQSVLAAAGLAVQPHADVLIDGREHPLSNFFVTVAETGERKTAADRAALAPILKFQHDRKKTYCEEIAAFEADRIAWKRVADDAASKKNEGREDKKDALLALGPEPTRPICPILLTEEPTYEGLVKALALDWPSMGLFSDEGGRFIGGHAMQRDNQLKSAAGLSKLWDGSPITRTRGGEGNIVLYGRRVSLHLMMQPNVSRLLFGSELLLGQGLLSRCLVTYPTSTIGSRSYRAEALHDRPVAGRYFARLMEILEAPLPLLPGERNELSPRKLEIATDAKQVWIAFHDHVEGLCREGRELYSIRGLATKAAEHALRLAGVLAFIDDLSASTIKRVHVEAGITLSQHYLAEALRLFEGAADDPDLCLAERLLAWLRTQRSSNGSGISSSSLVHLRQIYQYGPYAIRDKATAERVMGILENHGWVRRIEGGAEIDGQHRRQVWEVRL